MHIGKYPFQTLAKYRLVFCQDDPLYVFHEETSRLVGLRARPIGSFSLFGFRIVEPAQKPILACL
jgi:hypothetical protein